MSYLHRVFLHQEHFDEAPQRLPRVIFHQEHFDEALQRLLQFHMLTIEAEDEGHPQAHVLYRECRRYELIASLISATGVKDTQYADN